MAALLPVIVRFLPTQEWSSGRRGIGGESANSGTRHCEIPAYAGMVCLGTGDLLADSWLGRFGDGYATICRGVNIAAPIPVVAGMGEIKYRALLLLRRFRLNAQQSA